MAIENRLKQAGRMSTVHLSASDSTLLVKAINDWCKDNPSVIIPDGGIIPLQKSQINSTNIAYEIAGDLNSLRTAINAFLEPLDASLVALSILFNGTDYEAVYSYINPATTVTTTTYEAIIQYYRNY